MRRTHGAVALVTSSATAVGGGQDRGSAPAAGRPCAPTSDRRTFVVALGAAGATALTMRASVAGGPPPNEPGYPPALLRDFGAMLRARDAAVVAWYAAPIPGHEAHGPLVLGGLDPVAVLDAALRGEHEATPRMLGRPFRPLVHEDRVSPTTTLRFAFRSRENRRRFAALYGSGRLLIAYNGWCGWGAARAVAGLEPHLASPERAGFDLYSYDGDGGPYRVLVFQKGDRRRDWQANAAGVRRAANGYFEGLLAGGTQVIKRQGQPPFPPEAS